MARKTKKVVAVPAVELAVVEPLRIDEVSLLKLGKFSALERVSSLELATAQHRLNQLFQEWLKTNPEASAMSSKLDESRTLQQKAMSSYNATLQELSTRLKIDISKYTYDEDTGVLRELPGA